MPPEWEERDAVGARGDGGEDIWVRPRRPGGRLVGAVGNHAGARGEVEPVWDAIGTRGRG